MNSTRTPWRTQKKPNRVLANQRMIKSQSTTRTTISLITLPILPSKRRLLLKEVDIEVVGDKEVAGAVEVEVDLIDIRDTMMPSEIITIIDAEETVEVAEATAAVEDMATTAG